MSRTVSDRAEHPCEGTTENGEPCTETVSYLKSAVGGTFRNRHKVCGKHKEQAQFSGTPSSCDIPIGYEFTIHETVRNDDRPDDRWGGPLGWLVTEYGDIHISTPDHEWLLDHAGDTVAAVPGEWTGGHRSVWCDQRHATEYEVRE